MAVRGCGFCGCSIRYHGEPEGTTPVEHIFCRLNDWRELEVENLTADRLEWEHEEKFFYAWRCKRCGTFTFSSNYVNTTGVYAPNEEISSDPMQEPFEFGPFWDDILWFDITENSTPAAEVLAKRPGNLWLAKNDDELRFYTDEARTHCVAQCRAIPFVNPITVKTMSLHAFKKMLANWDDVEFTYHGVYYNFMREKDGSIDIWRGQGQVNSRYHAATTDIDEILNAPILQDGKSILQVQDEIEL